ncbi:hypothetical protein BDV12DRAFT_199568 [Aspergillus spectabilis]
MLSSTQTFTNPLPYHLLSYGTLLGTEIYQSFILTKVAFQSLPSREFLLLQKRLFPVYFRTQVGLAFLTAVTRPRPPSLPVSSISQTWGQTAWGVAPLVIVSVAGLLNWLVYGPGSSRTGAVRYLLQEAKRNPDKGDKPVDEETMKKANREFSRYHAMSIHSNLVALLATVWYIFDLAGDLSFAQ